jgi:mRNA-degrading endonuclease RelE of RelBE toxin-antitoxin system
VRTAIEVLERAPQLGVQIPGGLEVRKLRVANSELVRGKSGGYRLLYKLTEEPEPLLYLLLLYAKSDQADVAKDELQQLVDDLKNESLTPNSASPSANEASIPEGGHHK